ncbi:hypothetical protein N8I77_007441 [Diaporthe amygdali]|uniref:Uncharacterized protein n=1 Tax=Phomopsis amygdali TaxID=1214568 RepID=A0AAD9SC08_PHOAM|nr:hypothetical protein N8I77_007441 [Diaporthe amygdali]
MDETSGPSTPSLTHHEAPRAIEAATLIDLHPNNHVRLEPAESTDRREAEPSEQKVDHDEQSSIALTQIHNQGPPTAFHGLEHATEGEPIDSLSTLPDVMQDGFSSVAFDNLSSDYQHGSELLWTTGSDIYGYGVPLSLEGFESLLEPGSSEDHGAPRTDEAAATEDWETFDFSASG